MMKERVRQEGKERRRNERGKKRKGRRGNVLRKTEKSKFKLSSFFTELNFKVINTFSLNSLLS